MLFFEKVEPSEPYKRFPLSW